MTCEDVVNRDVVKRYLARTLSGEEEEQFEIHYLQCEQCQRGIELGLAARKVLRPEARPAEQPERIPLVQPKERRRLPVAAGVGLLAAAAGVALVFVIRAQGPDPALVELAGVAQPPIYLGLPVRAEATRADSLFQEAMDAYVKGHYRAAVAGLRGALDAGVEPAAAEFFLASSHLVRGRAAEAAEVYRRVISRGPSPYRDEARFYLAKALLQQGRREEALAELRAIAGGESVIAGEARALVTRLEGLSR